jgi:alpha-tubulin suppressor-like RCC1 family protein
MQSHRFSCGCHPDWLPRQLASMFALALMTAAVGCREDAESPTAPDAGPALAVTATTALTWRQVSAGAFHTCGVATDLKAYCWGLNRNGELGDGTTANRSRPTAVARGLQFIQISASDEHTCGVTTDSLVYCWGRGQYGRLGNGGTGNRVRPAPVAGGRRFRQVNTGLFHTCAVTSADRAYCWGDNGWGQLGDGTKTARLTPVLVAGASLRFQRLSAGTAHTCGVNTGDRAAYCWGDNGSGTLGDGTTTDRLTPVRVAGGLSFLQVEAGGGHTCGLATNNRAYCWGANVSGQVSHSPVLIVVGGGLSISQIVAGSGHDCAVTTGHQTYCWGYNFTGALGDGTEIDRVTPVAVAGGLQFSGVSPGSGYHTCGVTTLKRGYCWGHNAYGQLGNGTSTGPETCDFALPCSTKPKPVVGPS